MEIFRGDLLRLRAFFVSRCDSLRNNARLPLLLAGDTLFEVRASAGGMQHLEFEKGDAGTTVSY